MRRRILSITLFLVLLSALSFTIEDSLENYDTMVWEQIYDPGFEITIKTLSPVLLHQTVSGFILLWTDSTDLFLTKVTNVGRLLSIQKIALNRSLVEIQTMVPTTDGLVIVLQLYGENHIPISVLLLKIDYNGQIQWERDFDNMFVHNLIETSDSGFALVGGYFGQSNGSTICYIPYNCVGFVLKISSVGNTEWMLFQNNTQLYIPSTTSIIEEDNGFVILGYAQMPEYVLGNYMAWIARLDEENEYAWELQVPQSKSSALFYGPHILIAINDDYLIFKNSVSKMQLTKITNLGKLRWDIILYNHVGVDILEQGKNIVITGYIGGRHNLENKLFLLEINSFGRLIWEQNHPTSKTNSFSLIDYVPYDLIESNTGSFLIAGWITIGPGGTSSFVNRIFLSEFNQLTTFQKIYFRSTLGNLLLFRYSPIVAIISWIYEETALTRKKKISELYSQL